MSGQDNDDKSGIKQAALDRRKILLGSTTLVAASAIATSQPLQVAQAQQPAAPSGKKPNILVIFGDDIGQSNISAYRVMEQLSHPAQSD